MQKRLRGWKGEMRNIFFVVALLIFIVSTGCERASTSIDYQNDTAEPCPQVPICLACKPCPVCQPQIKKIEDKPCLDRQSDIIKSYAECLRNESRLQSLIDTNCINGWQHCNDTLRDYADRLNNISYYTKNR